MGTDTATLNRPPGARRFPARRASLVAALTVIGGLTPAVAPAATIQDLHIVRTAGDFRYDHDQTVRAYCPADKRVVGGGGWVTEESGGINPALTELRPVRHAGERDEYVVSAAETTSGTTARWRVGAYAMCAKPLPGMRIRRTPTSYSSKSVQAKAAVCPPGQRVLGTGGRVNTAAPGQVVLQVARPSHPGDIARVQAHEDATGYAGTWNVAAYAICAPRPDGYEVVFIRSLLEGSEPIKIAGDSASKGCPNGKQLVSPGAAITSVAPGNVSLSMVLPLPEFQRPYALAVANTPTPLDWDYIIASAVCAS